jgi:chromosomal replication initiation ATPase DnaA
MESEEGLKREEVYSTVDQRIQGGEEFVERVLAQYGGDGLDKGRGKVYSLSQIGNAVEKLYGLSTKELRSCAKTRQISFGRRVAYGVRLVGMWGQTCKLTFFSQLICFSHGEEAENRI